MGGGGGGGGRGGGCRGGGERLFPRLPLLSPDLLAEILCRLSVRMLLRLRMVAKSWRSFIDSHTFGHHHLSRSLPSRMVVGSRFGPFTYAFDSKGRHKERLCRFVKADGHITKLLSCCDGMLLFETSCRLQNMKKVLCIVNPATRKVVNLPAVTYGINSVVRMGQLVFDRASDVYKVVLLYKWPPEPDDGWEEACSVFTLGVDSHWRTFSVPRNCCFGYTHPGIGGWQFPTVRGAIHWIAAPASISDHHLPSPYPDGQCRSNRNWAIKIAAFRIEEESFHNIKGYQRSAVEDPGSDTGGTSHGRGRPCYFHVLAEYRGSLCLLCLDYREHTLDFWLLKDYTMQTWIRQHSLRSEEMLSWATRMDDRLWMLCLLYYTADGEIQLEVLMRSRCCAQRLSYDAQLGKLSTPMKMKPHKLLPHPTTIGFFTEGLVTVDINRAYSNCLQAGHPSGSINRFTFRDVHRDIIKFCDGGRQEFNLQHILDMVEVPIHFGTGFVLPLAAFLLCRWWIRSSRS